MIFNRVVSTIVAEGGVLFVDVAKNKIIEQVEQDTHQLVCLLQELISIPSDNPPGDCLAIATHVIKKLQDYEDFTIQVLPVDVVDKHATDQQKIVNVLATKVFGSGQGPEIVLNAHGDVVPPGLGWTFDPYGGEIHEGAIYGRGAAVSKSDIAVYTYAVLALQQVAEQLEGKIVLAFTFDEETGGELGPKWLLEEGYIKPDYAITAGFTYSIVNAHNGCLHLEVKTIGRSAHAASPTDGIDALEAMTGILHGLYGYRNTLKDIHSQIAGIDSPSLVIGLIQAGINTNVVPDECVIRLDRRMIPEEEADDVEIRLRHFIASLVDSYPGIRLEIRRILLAEAYGPIRTDERLIQTVATNYQAITGETAPILGVPLYTDARHFAEFDVPVIMFGAGPRTLEDANAHRANEHVAVMDLELATKIVSCSLYDLLKKR